MRATDATIVPVSGRTRSVAPGPARPERAPGRSRAGRRARLRRPRRALPEAVRREEDEPDPGGRTSGDEDEVRPRGGRLFDAGEGDGMSGTASEPRGTQARSCEEEPVGGSLRVTASGRSAPVEARRSAPAPGAFEGKSSARRSATTRTWPAPSASRALTGGLPCARGRSVASRFESPGEKREVAPEEGAAPSRGRGDRRNGPLGGGGFEREGRDAPRVVRGAVGDGGAVDLDPAGEDAVPDGGAGFLGGEEVVELGSAKGGRGRREAGGGRSPNGRRPSPRPRWLRTARKARG